MELQINTNNVAVKRTSTEVAGTFGVTNDYITQLCRKGKIKGSFEGRVWMVEEESLRQYLEQTRAKKNATSQKLSAELRSVARIAPQPEFLEQVKNEKRQQGLSKFAVGVALLMLVGVSGVHFVSTAEPATASVGSMFQNVVEKISTFFGRDTNVAPVVLPSFTQVSTTTIVQNTYPVIERTIERVGERGVSRVELDNKLVALTKFVIELNSERRVVLGGRTRSSGDTTIIQNISGGGGSSSFGQVFEITNGYLAPTTTLGILLSASSTINADFTVVEDFRVASLASCNTIDTDANGNFSCGTDEGGMGATFAYPFPNNATSTLLTFSGGALFTASTTINGNLVVTGNSTTTNATTTAFAITGVTSSLLKTLSNGAVVAAVAGTDYITTSQIFSYPFPNNATTTLLTFSGGILSTASSTIGDGTQIGGLTIHGGATTTGNAYFASGSSVAPSIAFTNSPTTGFYQSGSTIGFTLGGSNAGTLSTSALGIFVPVRVANCTTAASVCFAGFLSDNNNGVFMPAADVTAVATNGFERARFTGLGNFGVGTSSPFALLSIHAASTTGVSSPTTLFAIASSTAGTATTTLFSISNTGAASTTQFFGAGLATCQTENVLTWANGVFGCEGDTAGASSGGADFSYGISYFGTTTSATTTALWARGGIFASSTSRIASTTFDINGFVGIGSSTPFAQLSINPNGISGASFAIGSSTKTDFIVTNAGRVGIGTTTPSDKLHVWSTGNAIQILESTGGINYAYQRFLGSGSDYEIGVAGISASDIQNKFFIYDETALQYRLVIDSSGNFGLGTTSPWGRLSVDTSNASSGLPSFTVGSSTRTDFLVDQGGRVGIGTTSPFATFSIQAQSNNKVFFAIGSSTANSTSTVFSISNGTVTGGSIFAYGVRATTTIPHNTAFAWTISTTTTGNGSSTLFRIDTTSGAERVVIGVPNSDIIIGESGATANLVFEENATIKGQGAGRILTFGANSDTLKFGISSLTGCSGSMAIQSDISGTLACGVLPTPTAFPFVGTTNFGAVANSTSTPIWFTAGIQASSTSRIGALTVAGTVAFSALTQGAAALHDLCINSSTFEVVQNTNNTCSSSSKRFKHDIHNTDVGLDVVLAMQAVTFKYNEDLSEKEWLGFIAEEVEKIEPRLVAYDNAGLVHGVHYQEYTAVLTNAIKELHMNFEVLASTTASSTPRAQSFATAFFTNLFSRVSVWLGDASNGIGDLFANRVRTKELCISDEIGETCITKQKLDELLASVEPAVPVPEPTPEPQPEPQPTPEPEPIPEPSPEPEIEIEPEPAPEPESSQEGESEGDVVE